MATPVTGGIQDLGFNNDAWTDCDLSSYITGGATGVVIQVVNNGASAYSFGARKNGSTDDRYYDLADGGHAMIFIGVDSNQVVELRNEDDDVDFYLVSYFTWDAVFITNGLDKGPAGGAWNDVDISADTGADTAIAAFFEIGQGGATSHACGLRKKGSADDRTAFLSRHGWGCTGVDGSEVCQAYLAGAGPIPFLYLSGYLTTKSTWATDATDVSLASTGAYADLTQLSAGKDAAAYEIYATAGAYDGNIRQKGETEDLYYKPGGAGRHMWAILPANADRYHEGKIEHTDVDFFKLAEFDPVPTGVADITMPTAGAVSYTASTISFAATGQRISDSANRLYLSHTQTTISFDSATSEVRDSGNGLYSEGFRAGQTVTISGASEALNNQTTTISSIETDGSKMVVSGTLADEAAGASVTIIGGFQVGHTILVTRTDRTDHPENNRLMVVSAIDDPGGSYIDVSVLKGALIDESAGVEITIETQGLTAQAFGASVASVTSPSKTVSAQGHQPITAEIELPSFSLWAWLKIWLNASTEEELPKKVVDAQTGISVTADIALPDKEVAANAIPEAFLTGDLTLPKKTVTANWFAPGASITLPALTMEAQGNPGIVAQGDCKPSALTITATAKVEILCQFEDHLRLKVLEAHAIRGGGADADCILVTKEVEATAKTGPAVTASNSLPTFTVSATGFENPTAEVDLTMPVKEMSGNLVRPGRFDGLVLRHQRWPEY